MINRASHNSYETVIHIFGVAVAGGHGAGFYAGLGGAEHDTAECDCFGRGRAARPAES